MKQSSIKTKIIFLNIIFLIGFICLLSFHYHILADFSKVKEKLNIYNAQFPQQKVYLHTDKSNYSIGENIWFKAYVVKLANHTPDTLSTNLYVDLISPHGTIFQRLMLKLEEGFSYGDFYLNQDTLPEGIYQIKAYTNWMQNFDTEYIFTKYIGVSNPVYQNYLVRKRAKKNKIFNKKFRKAKKTVTVQFFPEGGTFLYDIQNRVAYKVENDLGEGVNFKGMIIDKKGNVVAPLQSYHNGMGAFTIIPQKDNNYHLVTESFGRKQKFELPAAQERGINMSVDNISDKQNIIVKIGTNIKTDYNEIANEVYIVGLVRNELYYSSSTYVSPKGVDIAIQRNNFPTGVVQFTVFNNRIEPICERLVFVDHKDYSNIEINLDKEITDEVDHILYDIQVKKDEKPVEGNISVSVLAGTDSVARSNILTELLLTSDCQGRIEDPDFYFTGTKKAQQALDYLLLTQGWRRFEWEKIINGEYPEGEYSIEDGITITGKITRMHLDIPIKNSKVTLYIMDEYNDFFTHYTDRKGRYQFSGLEYYDTIDVKIEARTPQDRKNLLIYVDETESPPALFNERNALLEDYKRKKLVVPNYEKLPEEELHDYHKIHGDADFVLDLDKINTDGYNDLFEVLRGRVPGVNVTENNVIIRGRNSVVSGQSPLVILDGISTDVSVLGIIPPRDVHIIEIIKGPQAAVYGFRGANGVIAIYTRRGHFMTKGEISFRMLGYYKARKFYRPILKENKLDENSRVYKSSTIYWNPQVLTDSTGRGYIKINKDDIENDMVFSIEGLSYNGDIIQFVNSSE